MISLAYDWVFDAREEDLAIFNIFRTYQKTACKLID
jgi:hypothetical protein